MERTGHRRVVAVRSYKRSSTQQQERISDIVNNGHPTKHLCLASDADLMSSCPSVNSPSTSHIHSVSLEYASAAAPPVLNFSSCASVTVEYNK